MSLLNNSNSKNKKGNKAGSQQKAKSGIQSAKGRTNTKGAARNAKFTGGAQRGS
jgi:hypothetical protein